MLLPANCPYAAGVTMPAHGRDTIACCRVTGSFCSPVLDDDPPLCRCPGEEVYRFAWQSSFDGTATVQITRQGEDLLLRWESRWHLPETGLSYLRLCMSDWHHLKAALGAAAFWTLDPYDNRMGLDGACWTVAGRRGDSFHVVSLWSPEQEGLRNVGRLFFRLAGPPLAAVRLY